MKELTANGAIVLSVDGTEVSLTQEDLLITPANKSGFTAQSEAGITVVLDTNITDALRREGYMRELVSKIQTMRKEIGLEVTDHIRLTLTAEQPLVSIAEEFSKDIQADCLADVLLFGEAGACSKEWDINDLRCVISIQKV